MEIKLSFRPTPFDLDCLQTIEAQAAPLKGFSPAFSALVSQTAAAPPDWREVQRHAVPGSAKGPASNPITLSVDQEEWNSVRMSINRTLGIVRPRTSFLIRMTLVYGLMLSIQAEPSPVLEVTAEHLDGLHLVEQFVRLLQSQDPADKAKIQTIASLLKNHETGGTT